MLRLTKSGLVSRYRLVLPMLLISLVISGFSVATASAENGVCPHDAAATAGGTWDARAATVLYRSETAAAVLDGKIYIGGGLVGRSPLFTEISDSVAMYDPAADKWQDVAKLPKRLHHVALAAANGYLYASGGYESLDFVANQTSMWRYAPADDKWQAVAAMPAPRAAHLMVTIGKLIYLVGGVTSASTQLWTYNPATDTWDTKHAPMPTAREHAAGLALDGKLVVMGGEVPNSDGTGIETAKKLATTEVYDPASDTWSPLPDMPTARSSITAAVLDGQIHVVSGENAADICVFAQHEVYDPTTKMWTTMTDMLTPRHGAVSGVVDNHWYVIDGATRPGFLTITALTNTVDVFSPDASS